MGWLIFFAILLALGCLPLGVRLRYDAQGFVAAALVGRIPIVLYPVSGWLNRLLSGRKKPKAKTAEQPKKETPKEEKPKEQTPSKGGPLERFLPFVRLGLDFLGDFRRKLRVNRLVLKLTLAGSDPCDLAVNYGRAWTAVGNLLPQLDRAFVIQKRDVEVQCDFLAENTSVIFGMDITMTLGRFLGLAAVYGIRAVGTIQTIKKKKAVQTNE